MVVTGAVGHGREPVCQCPAPHGGAEEESNSTARLCSKDGAERGRNRGIGMRTVTAVTGLNSFVPLGPPEHHSAISHESEGRATPQTLRAEPGCPAPTATLSLKQKIRPLVHARGLCVSHGPSSKATGEIVPNRACLALDPTMFRS